MVCGVQMGMLKHLVASFVGVLAMSWAAGATPITSGTHVSGQTGPASFSGVIYFKVTEEGDVIGWPGDFDDTYIEVNCPVEWGCPAVLTGDDVVSFYSDQGSGEIRRIHFEYPVNSGEEFLSLYFQPQYLDHGGVPEEVRGTENNFTLFNYSLEVPDYEYGITKVYPVPESGIATLFLFGLSGILAARGRRSKDSRKSSPILPRDLSRYVSGWKRPK